MSNQAADHQCTMIPVKPNTGVVATSLEGYFCPWCEIAQLRLDLAQQAINASTIIEMQTKMVEADDTIESLKNLLAEWLHWFGSTNNVSGRTRRALDVGDKHGD